MKLRILIIISASVIFANSVLAQQNNPDLPTGTVRGVVTDSSGNTLSNVFVKVVNYGDTTDKNGEFQIDMLEPGIRVVEASEAI